MTQITPVLAEQGLAEVAPEDVAAGAGVTRNLLCHYFPRPTAVG
jgi:AcrR family transcriptional regulator